MTNHMTIRVGFIFLLTSVGSSDDVSFCDSEAVTLSTPNEEYFITTPFFPNEYPPRQDCTFNIQAAGGYRVRVEFVEFELERANDFGICAYDYIRMYDGISDDAPTFGVFCGETSPPTVISSSRRMLMTFHSDGSLQGSGFKASLMMVDSDYEEEIPVPDPSTCYEILEDPAGTFLSPGYPNRYPNDDHCTYIISLPTNDRILLRFTTFDLEASYNCIYDYVEIRDGLSVASPLIGRYCGGSQNDPPSPIESSGSDLFVTFRSDFSERFKGFYAEYVDRNTGFPEIDGSEEVQDVRICDISRSVLNTKGGSIVSHRGDGPYPRSKTCTIQIVGDRPSEKVFVNVVLNDLVPTPVCGEEGDYLKLDITPTTQLCGDDKGHFSSDAPSVSITLHSEDEDKEDYKGFRLVYAVYYEDFHGCEEGYFQCENNRCILQILTCDGFNHCGDRSDETEICDGSFDTTWIFALVTILVVGILFMCCIAVLIKMAKRTTPYRSPRSAANMSNGGAEINRGANYPRQDNADLAINPIAQAAMTPPSYSQIWANSTSTPHPPPKDLYEPNSVPLEASPLAAAGDLPQPRRGMLPPIPRAGDPPIGDTPVYDETKQPL